MNLIEEIKKRIEKEIDKLERELREEEMDEYDKLLTEGCINGLYYALYIIDEVTKNGSS